MFSRRDVLRLGSLAAGVTAAPSLAEAQSGAVPPSLAALQSMKSQATPIANAERLQRIEKARRLMVDAGLDAIAMRGGTSLVYFSNIRWWNSERLFLMILPAKGAPFYVCPAFEEDRAREQIAAGPLGAGADVRTWQ